MGVPCKSSSASVRAPRQLGLAFVPPPTAHLFLIHQGVSYPRGELRPAEKENQEHRSGQYLRSPGHWRQRAKGT